MGNDPATFGAAILSLRLLLHVITAVTLVCYLSSQRSRFFPTLAAWLGGGGSMAAFFQGVTQFSERAPTTEPWVMCVVMAFAIVCLMSRGNLARPFNFKRYSRR